MFWTQGAYDAYEPNPPRKDAPEVGQYLLGDGPFMNSLRVWPCPPKLYHLLKWIWNFARNVIKPPILKVNYLIWLLTSRRAFRVVEGPGNMQIFFFHVQSCKLQNATW